MNLECIIIKIKVELDKQEEFLLKIIKSLINNILKLFHELIEVIMKELN